MNEVTYRSGNDLPLSQVRALYQATALGERRPIQDAARMKDMITNANLVVTAWINHQLVGLARTLTDFTFVGYMADLLVHEAHQNRGIGTRLIAETRSRMGAQSKLVLLSLDSSNEYYRRIGFTELDGAWLLRASDRFPI
jgi:ribosomal protein S18 acetylase RimI-like enzyme